MLLSPCSARQVAYTNTLAGVNARCRGRWYNLCVSRGRGSSSRRAVSTVLRTHALQPPFSGCKAKFASHVRRSWPWGATGHQPPAAAGALRHGAWCSTGRRCRCFAHARRTLAPELLRCQTDMWAPVLVARKGTVRFGLVRHVGLQVAHHPAVCRLPVLARIAVRLRKRERRWVGKRKLSRAAFSKHSAADAGVVRVASCIARLRLGFSMQEHVSGEMCSTGGHDGQKSRLLAAQSLDRIRGELLASTDLARRAARGEVAAAAAS